MQTSSFTKNFFVREVCEVLHKYLVDTGGLVVQLAVIAIFFEPWIKEDAPGGERDPLDWPLPNLVINFGVGNF